MTSVGPAAREHRSRRGLLGVIGGLVLLVCAVLALLAVTGSDAPSPGPLVANEEGDFSFNALTRRPFVYGLAIARNGGEETAVMDSIALDNPSFGLKLVETHVAGAARKLLAQASDDKWPSDLYDDVRQVAGFELAPDSTSAGRRGVELILVMSARSPGRYTATGVVVDYHVGETAHRVTLDTTMAVCVSQKLNLKPDCKPVAPTPAPD